MHGVMHFALVAGATIASIQLALMAMDKLGVPSEPGFGVDDVIEGVLVALGVSLTVSLLRPMIKAA